MCRWFESNRGSQEELIFSVPLFSWLGKTAKSQQLPLLDSKGGTWQQSGGLLQPPWLCRGKASPTGGAKKRTGKSRFSFFLVRKDGGKPERVSAVWLLVVVKLIQKSRVIYFPVQYMVEDDLFLFFKHLVEHQIFFNHDHTKSKL